MNRKPRLRRPDGTPEMRSIDEMLQAAVDDDTYRNLPGKGKPLNLGDYFSPGADFRVAGKLLKDNQILPQHLQERKDAEAFQREAEALFNQGLAEMPGLEADFKAAASPAIAPFTDRQTCLDCLGLETWPAPFPDPAGAPITRSDHRKAARDLEQLIARYNARVRNLIYRYLENLRKAQENIINCQKHQMLNRSVTPTYMPLRPIDLDACEKDIRTRFPLLPELPPGIDRRLKAWHRQQNPPFWKRIWR